MIFNDDDDNDDKVYEISGNLGDFLRISLEYFG